MATLEFRCELTSQPAETTKEAQRVAQRVAWVPITGLDQHAHAL